MYEYKGFKWPNGKTFYLNANLGYTKNFYSPSISYNFYLYDENDQEEVDPLQLIVGPDFSCENEANARAQMLIYLKENNHI